INRKRAKVKDGQQAEKIIAEVKEKPFVVDKVERKETKRFPQPPFTTSKLQQEAARSLGFTAKKTMNIAQRLYEGIELGPEGPVGLITYMRTDSVRIAAEALEAARAYLKENYDAAYLPARPVTYKNTSSAQDAHEAIRPSSPARKPQDIKKYLSPDEFRLYQLIWNRFMASQMTPALFDQTIIECSSGPYQFRAQGSIMKFPGYTLIYKEAKEETPANGDDELGRILPECVPGETLKLLDVKGEQKFTQPPPRFSEATLVKELEEKGIGRPSTYAAILSTIQERQYVRLEKGRFVPTELGMLVNDLLVRNFPRIVDVAFTAAMENELDGIEEGKANRIDTLRNFYETFADELRKAGAAMGDEKQQKTLTDVPCEACGSPMLIKWGKNGDFLACSNYPQCRHTQNFSRDEKGNIIPATEEKQTTDTICDQCGRPMVIKKGRYGPFLGCTGYPECRHIVNFSQDEKGTIKPLPAEKTDMVCEKCGRPMTVKRGRYGTFFGCSGYPECRHIVRAKGTGDGKAKADAVTVDTVCDRCGRPMAIRRGRYGSFLGCTGYPECKNIMKIPPKA
ncbi:MAG: type I DNA topoisomerase, partial [Syntrophales bacterium]|nr:type I DNA topoisomerase [Syntrophales bacterium]